MIQPNIVAKEPTILELEAGTYYFCTCGLSSDGLFCNGSHKGTEFTPKQFILEEKQKVALCRCKFTNNPPNCDGTHSKL